MNRDVAATWQTSRSFDRDGKNSEFRPEISVLTLRLKRSIKVSSKVLKTIYWLPRYIFIYMLRNLDFKNIFLWLGFSHFFAMLYFFSFFFCLRDGRHLEAHAPTTWHGIFTLHVLTEFWKVHLHATWHAHWSSVHHAGTFRLKWKKKEPKKISFWKSRSWLLVKNSKRHL